MTNLLIVTEWKKFKTLNPSLAARLIPAPRARGEAGSGPDSQSRIGINQNDRDIMATTKPGERKLQILQTLAAMLEQPKGEKITTAALAGKLDVSEAALYRHFASKAQMFEGLIEFIESSVFGLINQITAQQENGLSQAQAIAGMLLNFAERNPGMTRVMIGDALVNEDERLQTRMNQFIERIELALKQALRTAVSQGQGSEAEV